MIYVAGVVVLFWVALGIGATAAVVIGWQSGRNATGSSETRTLGGGKSETTGFTETSMSEGNKLETTGTSEGTTGYSVNEASFTHRATDKNSRGDYTYISDPSIDGDAKAIILVSHKRNAGATRYRRTIGVWYVAGARKWAIFDQDRAAVPAGATFKVTVPPASAKFVHYADLLNTAGNYTYLDNRLTNGNPDAALSVTQNWNPGGGRGVYNDHPVTVLYDPNVEKWAIYNRDGAPMPEGAAFNVAVSTGAK